MFFWDIEEDRIAGERYRVKIVALFAQKQIHLAKNITDLIDIGHHNSFA